MQSAMAWLRACGARGLEAGYNVCLFTFGGVFQGAATDERPARSANLRVPVSTISPCLRRCFGFARFLLRVGGPNYKIAGSVHATDRGDLFTPVQWWSERGATEGYVSPHA